MGIRLGINPLTWTIDDLPEVGGETPLETCLAEAKAAGFEGVELGCKFPRTVPELRAALAPHGKLGVIGFSFGGAWSMVLSTLRPDDIGAVTLFYGIYGGVDFTKCKAAFLGHFAENELYDEPFETRRKNEAKMKDMDLSVTFHMYPGTGHWFFEENRPDAYDAQSARLAWERTLAFLREHLT